MILFEPSWRVALFGPALLALRTKALEREQLPDCYFAMVELDIQRLFTNAVFLAALAKLHLEFMRQ